MATKTESMQYPIPKRKAPGLFEHRDAGDFDFKFIKYEKTDGIAKVTINRTEVYNSYNLQTLREMTEAFDDVASDDRIGVVVLRGEGDKAFCTGGDVKEYADMIVLGKSQDMWHWMNCFVRAHDALRNTGKTSIAHNRIVVFRAKSMLLPILMNLEEIQPPPIPPMLETVYIIISGNITSLISTPCILFKKSGIQNRKNHHTQSDINRVEQIA